MAERPRFGESLRRASILILGSAIVIWGLNTVMVRLVGMVGTQIFWGVQSARPLGG